MTEQSQQSATALQTAGKEFSSRPNGPEQSPNGPESTPSRTRDHSRVSFDRGGLARANNQLWRRRIQSEEAEQSSLGELLDGHFAERLGGRDLTAIAGPVVGLPRRHITLPQDARNHPQWNAAMTGLSGRIGSGYVVGLIGPRGTGKTQLAIDVMRRTCIRGRTGLYVKAQEIFLAIRSTYGTESEACELDILAHFIRPSCLVIDEIQERAEKPWEDRLLTYIVDKRYDAVRDTILIGNLGASAMSESLGPSIIDRLRETGGVIECNWGSFRNKPKQDAE